MLKIGAHSQVTVVFIRVEVIRKSISAAIKLAGLVIRGIKLLNTRVGASPKRNRKFMIYNIVPHATNRMFFLLPALIVLFLTQI